MSVLDAIDARAVASPRGGNDQTVRLPDFTMIQSERELLRLGWRPADPPRRLVLFVNLASGNGAAPQAAGDGRARESGIEVMVLAPGEDLAAVARTARGDWSLAVVSAVAASKETPVACVAAVTGNHFVPDVSIGRHDRPAALETSTGTVERRPDVAEVNGRVFRNNVCLGICGYADRPPARLPRRRDAIHRGDGAGGVGPLRPGTVAALWPVDGMMTTTGQVHRMAPAGSMSGLPRLVICRGRSLWPLTISGPRRHRG